MNYYISDLHIGCTNFYENRTLDIDSIIKENWNKTVNNNDIVYILGDIGKCGNNKDNEYLCGLISTLKGNKILIKGNHDDLRDNRIKQLFKEIYDYKEIIDNFNEMNHKLILSHFPILMWDSQHKGSIHLYGHVHNSEEDFVYKKSLQFLNDYFMDRELKGHTDCPQAKAYNVGCMVDYINYTPRTLKEIINNNI